MKKIQQKAKIKKQEPILIKINPNDLKNGIVLPKVRYEVLATIGEETVFNGMVLPLPRVLVYYLTHIELMLISIIIEDTNEYGECARSVKDLAIRTRASVPTISAALYQLRKAGLLLERSNGKRGAGRNRKINYEAVQHLNDLVEGEDPGVYTRIRAASRKKDILNMTKDDVRMAYDNYVLEPDHDPAEEEEYD